MRTEKGVEFLRLVMDTGLPRDELIHTLLATASALLMEYHPADVVAQYLHEVADLIEDEMERPLH